MHINLSLVVSISVGIAYVWTSYVLEKRLGRPDKLPDNLGVWLVVCGSLLGSFLKETYHLQHWWSAAIVVGATGAVHILLLLFLPRAKA